MYHIFEPLIIFSLFLQTNIFLLLKKKTLIHDMPLQFLILHPTLYRLYETVIQKNKLEYFVGL